MRGYHEWFPRPNGKKTGEWTPDYVYQPWVPPLLEQAAPDARILVIVRDPVERFVSGLTHSGLVPGSHLGTVVAESVDRGFYAAALQRWAAAFESHRILVLQYERCVADPAQALARTYRFLELDDGFRPTAINEAASPTREPKVALEPEARRRLVELYRDDVAALVELVPDLDLSLWANFPDGPGLARVSGPRRRDRPGALRGTVGPGQVETGELGRRATPIAPVRHEAQRQPHKRAGAVQGPADRSVPLADVPLDRRVQTESVPGLIGLGSARGVLSRHRRTETDLPASLEGTTLPVLVLAVQEEPFVEPADLREARLADEQDGAAQEISLRPQSSTGQPDGFGPCPRRRVPGPARPAGGVGARDVLGRCHTGEVGVGEELLVQPVQRVGTDPCVGVEQEHVAGGVGEAPQCKIDRGREPEVGARVHVLGARGADHGRGGLRGRVVHHERREPVLQRGQRAVEHVGRAVGDDDDIEPRRGRAHGAGATRRRRRPTTKPVVMTATPPTTTAPATARPAEKAAGQ